MPKLRLVYLPLSLDIVFRHVPEIPEGFQHLWFVAAGMTAGDIIDTLIDELGIRRVVLMGTKSARVEYALELEDTTVVPVHRSITEIIKEKYIRGPPYVFVFTLSRAWFAKLGTVSRVFGKDLQRPELAPVSISQPSQPTESPTKNEPTSKLSPSKAHVSNILWKPKSMYNAWLQRKTSISDLIVTCEDDEDKDKGGATLKARPEILEPACNSSSTILVGSPSSKPGSGNSRLSSLFHGWLRVDASDIPIESDALKNDALKNNKETVKIRHRIVSEPVVLLNEKTLEKHFMSLGKRSDALCLAQAIEEDSNTEDLETAMEALMNDLGLKEAQRSAMMLLADDRKRFLIRQHGVSESKIPTKPAVQPVSRDGTLSGMKRLSLATLGWSTPEAKSTETLVTLQSPDSDPSRAILEGDRSDPFQSSMTHTSTSSWTSWFSTGLGSAETTENSNEDSPQFYIAQLKSNKITLKNLVRSLIALRVRLSTAKIAWIKQFVQEAKGVPALDHLLRRIAGKRSRRYAI